MQHALVKQSLIALAQMPTSTLSPPHSRPATHETLSQPIGGMTYVSHGSSSTNFFTKNTSHECDQNIPLGDLVRCPAPRLIPSLDPRENTPRVGSSKSRMHPGSVVTSMKKISKSSPSQRVISTLGPPPASCNLSSKKFSTKDLSHNSFYADENVPHGKLVHCPAPSPAENTDDGARRNHHSEWTRNNETCCCFASTTYDEPGCCVALDLLGEIIPVLLGCCHSDD